MVYLVEIFLYTADRVFAAVKSETDTGFYHGIKKEFHVVEKLSY